MDSVRRLGISSRGMRPGDFMRYPRHIRHFNDNLWTIAPPQPQKRRSQTSAPSQFLKERMRESTLHQELEEDKCNWKQLPMFNRPAAEVLFPSSPGRFNILKSCPSTKKENEALLQRNKPQPLACPKRVAASSKLPSNGIFDSDDVANQNDVFLTDFVDKLLEDTDSDYRLVEDVSCTPDHLYLGEGSIENLATKLANVELIDDPKPNYKEEVLPPAGMHMPQHARCAERKPKYSKSYGEPPVSFAKKRTFSFPLGDRGFKNKENVGSSGHFKRMKICDLRTSRWSKPCIKNRAKDAKKTDLSGIYNTSQTCHQQSMKQPNLLNYFNKSVGSQHYVGSVPYWVPSSTGSKSDNSCSSSNSSVHREFVGQISSDKLKFKEVFKGSSSKNGFDKSAIQSSTQKAYSSSSSSTGKEKYSECVFCKTNGETPAIYRSHVLKDNRGRTVCQVLQKYECPICKATGYEAHTMKYCPENLNPPRIATMTTLKSMRTSTGRKRFQF